jgi:hypothetical protein
MAPRAARGRRAPAKLWRASLRRGVRASGAFQADSGFRTLAGPDAEVGAEPEGDEPA